eukprot:scaffold7474_cov63-Phaeocystis_antarctica.AAC.7
MKAATAAGVVRQLARHDGEMPRDRVRAAAQREGGDGARGAARARGTGRARSARDGGSAAAAGQQKGEGRRLPLPSHMAEPTRKEGAAALTEVFGCRRVRAVERPNLLTLPTHLEPRPRF